MRMNSLLKRSFAGNSTKFSFLTVSLYGTREKKLKAVVRRLPSRAGVKYFQKYSNTLQLLSVMNDYNYITITRP